jgi:CubicO group peptidase (beta-lactamase class C family)
MSSGNTGGVSPVPSLSRGSLAQGRRIPAASVAVCSLSVADSDRLSGSEAGRLVPVDAASHAALLQDTLRSAGAGSGAVACRTGRSGLTVSAWGDVGTTSVFEGGSVTKAITGLLLALAIDAGEVSSSDRLDGFLPGTGDAGSATLAELATHSSGLPRLGAAALARSLAHPRDPYHDVSLHRLTRDARLARLRRRRRDCLQQSRRGPTRPSPCGRCWAVVLGPSLDPGAHSAGHDEGRGPAQVRAGCARYGMGSRSIRTGRRPPRNGR